MASNKMTVTIGMTKDIIEVCHQLIQDRDNLQTHLDLSAQAIDAVTAERDEARAWARRMKRERDAARKWARRVVRDIDIAINTIESDQ